MFASETKSDLIRSAPQVLVWPSSQSRNASDFIFPSSSTTLLSPRVCQNNSAPSPRLLVVVCSAVPHLAARATIRESWARDAASLGSVGVVFLLGRQQQGDNTLQLQVSNESQEYGDIVQEDFIDTYANLTVKTLMLLKWFTENCPDTQYVMKTDDDMYINLVKLHEVVQSTKDPQLLTGMLNQKSRPITDTKSKWFAPSYMFTNNTYPEFYPDFLSGLDLYIQHMTIPC